MKPFPIFKSLQAIYGLCVFTVLAGPESRAATRTWDGGGANNSWMNATNWVGDVAPVAGDDLVFPPGPAELTAANNFPAGTTFNSIIFAGGGYTLSGNSIALNAGILATNGSNNYLYNSVVLNSNQTFTISVGSSSFNLPTAIDLNGKDLTFSVGLSTFAQVQAVISGAGGLVKTNSGTLLLYASNTFSGSVQILQGGLNIYNGNALGSTNGNTTVAAGAGLVLTTSSGTVPEPLVLSGTLSGNSATLTGPVTLAATNATIQVPSGESFKINAVISGTNGFTKTFPGVLTLNSNNTYTGTTTVSAGTLRVNGSQPASPIVQGLGTLGGTGTVGTVTVSGVGLNTIAPGGSPGILTCSNVTLHSTTTFAVELNGTTPGSSYDQLNVHGTVDLGGSTLNVVLGFTPAIGDAFTIVNNDGSDAVIGTFSGLPQGAVFTNSGALFSISYTGGDGNDVALYRGIPPSQLTVITPLPNGVKEIQGLGLSNLTYTIQAATNLNPVIQWSNIGIAPANGSGVFTFTDTNAPLFPMRFYRALSP